MFIFPRENNTGLPPVPFHNHSSLHTLKIIDFSVKLICMQRNKAIFSDEKKLFILNLFVRGGKVVLI